MGPNHHKNQPLAVTASAVALLLCLHGAASAFVVPSTDLYMQLAQPAQTRLGAQECAAPAGALVQVLGYPSSPDDASARSMVTVRVLQGPCRGYTATLDEVLLRETDQRP